MAQPAMAGKVLQDAPHSANLHSNPLQPIPEAAMLKSEAPTAFPAPFSSHATGSRVVKGEVSELPGARANFVLWPFWPSAAQPLRARALAASRGHYVAASSPILPSSSNCRQACSFGGALRQIAEVKNNPSSRLPARAPQDVIYIHPLSIATSPPSMLYMVCDGHSGVEAANYVAANFLRVLNTRLPARPPPINSPKGAPCSATLPQQSLLSLRFLGGWNCTRAAQTLSRCM